MLRSIWLSFGNCLRWNDLKLIQMQLSREEKQRLLSQLGTKKEASQWRLINFL